MSSLVAIISGTPVPAESRLGAVMKGVRLIQLALSAVSEPNRDLSVTPTSSLGID